MLYLIPDKTLSYYLTNVGFLNFKCWYKSIQLFEPIYNELEIITDIIEKINWSEDKLRLELFENIKDKIIKYCEIVLKKSPELIYNEWIISIQPYCFQGGIGHRIQYGDNNIYNQLSQHLPQHSPYLSHSYSPHHWCVKPEYYDIVLNIPDNVKLSAIICDKYIKLSEKSELQYWCN
jgi:hypothetical protein